MKVKFDVHIDGTLPDCLEIEARDEQSAINHAVDYIIDRLTFTVRTQEEPGGSNCDQVKPRSV
jgi:hypothetical protein